MTITIRAAAATAASSTVARSFPWSRTVGPAVVLHSLQQQRPSVRFYRGDSGEGQQQLSEKEERLLQLALPRAETIMERHVRLPNLDDIPVSSLGSNNNNSTTIVDNDNVLQQDSIDKTQLALDVRRKRLIYRSKQRGWLEVDLLLGTWAHENVPTLTTTELDEFEDFVNEETIDIYNLITLRIDAIPDHLESNGVVRRIQAWAKDSPLGKADPDAYKAVKTAKNLI